MAKRKNSAQKQEAHNNDKTPLTTNAQFNVEGALGKTHNTTHVEALIEATHELALQTDEQEFNHTSGAPQERSLVLGGEDPRDEQLKETLTSEQEVWQGHIFSVSRIGLELPDGRLAEHDVIRHPGAVAIVALTNDGRICLVRQHRTSINRVTLEIPAGKLDPGEDPLECAQRELLEETGMQAEKFGYLTSILSSVGFTDEIIHIYMATGLHFSESHPDADEFINVDLVELSELIDAVLDGRIEDGKTVVGALICDAVAHRLEPTDV